MITLLRLAIKSAWSRRMSLGLTLASIVLAASLLVSIERLRDAARENFSQSVSGVDLLVGARGSPMSLTLYALFRVGDPVNNMAWHSFEKISADPMVAWTVPLSLGDSHRSYPVLGTTTAYFDHYQYGEHQPLHFAEGSRFHGIFDVVIGSEVARQLRYHVGARLTLTHGSGAVLGRDHTDKPFTVVGILAPTGTPVDRTLHVSLAAIEAIHLDWQGGAPIPGLVIPPNQVQKFDLTPKTITAMIVGLKARTLAFKMQRAVAAFTDEPLTAVLPGIALDQLWQRLATGEAVLRAISWLVLAASLAGLMAVLFASINERRRELAILRSVGAGRRHLVFLLALEALLVSLVGVLIALLLVSATAYWGRPWLAQFGIIYLPLLPSPGEWLRLGAIPLAAVLVSLPPAWLACRRALADGLTPHV